MDILKLIRVHQWYKNLVIFLPLIFAGILFSKEAFFLTSLGFLSLCFVSSAGYLINDIVDKKNDRFHPEKRLRPLAKGTFTSFEAFFLSILLLIVGTIIAFILAKPFMYAVLILFQLTLIYTLFLKKEPFADILTIAVNFVIRAVSGALLLNVRISPWLILCTFFLSLFLSVAKRKADFTLLKEDAAKYKPVFRYYTPEIMQMLLIISTVALIISYSFYSFLSIYESLLMSLPFALYVIFRFIYLIYSGNTIARRPEKVYTDQKLSIGVLLWMFTVLLIIY